MIVQDRHNAVPAWRRFVAFAIVRFKCGNRGGMGTWTLEAVGETAAEAQANLKRVIREWQE